MVNTGHNAKIFSKNDRRFLIAVSFSGEYRKYVKSTCDLLSKECSRERILYDEYHEAEFARANLDTYLQDLYLNHSKLIVVFLCKSYNTKSWCGAEWRVLRPILYKKNRLEDMMFVRLDPGEVDGVFGAIDGAIDARKKSPQELSCLIMQRLKQTLVNDKR